MGIRCAGRASNGNLAISEITVAQNGAAVKLRAAWGSHSDANNPAAHTADGIADSPEERYAIPVPAAAAGAGPRMIVLRATDILGNVSTLRVDVP